MSQVAQELDEVVMDLVRDALRPYVGGDEITLGCMAIDVIRNINEAKYVIASPGSLDDQCGF
jgi:hypothetical protein